MAQSFWVYSPPPPADHPLRDMLMAFGAVVLFVGVVVAAVAGVAL